ncbi:hypothetical protein SteCoe_29864 [Stentor coeruleus]|uniref:Uncharacterized protein n=1 Tax=Stentor coeruleus TaxID=5963 RepID=A0A1R2B504_9CILI|nr:hypothetical protein SteCoe_29864 [Stentor coeruleus]
MLLHEIDGPEPEPSMKVTEGVPPEEPLNTKIGFEVRKKKVYYKKILERGIGWEKPGEDDEITMSIADVTDMLQDYGDPQVYTKNDLFPSFFRAIRDLKKGEISQIHIPKSMNEGVAKIFRVKMIDWISCQNLEWGMRKRIKVKGKDTSIARRDECRMNMIIYQGNEIIYEINDFYNRIEIEEVGPGVAEILRAMKKYETSVTQVKIDVFREQFSKFATFNMTQEDVFVEIQITKFLKYHDISLDCTFFKCELEDGTGDRTLPNNNAKVSVWYRYIIEEQIVDTNWDSEPVTFYMDEDEVPTLWINCARQMKVGDVYKVECDLSLPKVTEMSDGLLERYHFSQFMKPGVRFAYFYIKNLSFVIGRPNNLLNLQERLEESKRVKAAADKFFHIGLFARAHDKYKAATQFVEPFTDDEDNYKSQLIILYRNMSLCNFKTNKFIESSEDATKVLEMSPADIKALYRRAVAKRETRNYPQAIEDLKKAIEISRIKKDESSLKQLSAELVTVNKLHEEFLQREKELFTGIFK